MLFRDTLARRYRLPPIAHALLLLLLALLLPRPQAHAGSDFSTGVSDDRLSLPEGPGSLEGLGDNVDIDPNMALMRWPVPIGVPAGFAGVTPDIKLQYGSGSGNGVVGIGWTLETQSVERMTSRGLPVYDGSDLFAAGGGDELVRISAGTAPVLSGTVYRSRFEKGFVRYLWHDQGSDGADGYWEAQYPDGSVGFYGADASGTVVHEARHQGNGGTFSYLLVDKVDVHGHVLRYSYVSDPGGVSLVDTIAYVFKSDGTPRYRVQLSYEDRPDVLSDCQSGVDLRLTTRLKTIRVLSNSEIISRYELTYDAETLSGGLSRLARVESFGLNNERYPVVHSFGYSQALGASCSGADCGQPYLKQVSGSAVQLASGKATLVDMNGDALPDVVDTTASGAHQIYLNQLASDGAQSFAAPTSSAVGTGGGHTLGTAYVQVLDANGDGFSDLLNALSGEILINHGTGDWASKELLGSSNGYPNLGEDAELRFLDYDNDRRIDVIHSDASNTMVWRNAGSAGFVQDADAQTLGAGFASDNVQFADMNGDGLLDAVRVRQGEVSYRLNLGRGRWSGTTSSWTTITGLPISDTEADLAMLEDLNGDGLADLLVVSGNQVRYALSRNGSAFHTAQTLTSAQGGSIPERTPQHVVLCADMNGNGSQDIVWFDSAGAVTYLELFPQRPHLLTRIENGMGRVSEIGYSTSVQQAAAAREAGAPWAYRLPFPMTVVQSIDEYDLLSDVHDVEVYTYRDGFYDGVEKQFRGYENVEVFTEGDDSQEEGLSLSTFEIGVDDPYRAGLLIRQQIESGGQPLTETLNTWGDDADCPVAEVPLPAELIALGRKPVRHVCKTHELIYNKERQTQDAWVTTEESMEYDGYGNVVLAIDHGVTEVGLGACGSCDNTPGHYCGPQCLGDEKYTRTFYVPTTATAGRWITGAEYKVQVYGREGSAQRMERITYYDGAAFVGLGEGTLTKGLVSRVTDRKDTSDATILLQRQRHDSHGHVVETLDALGEVGGNSHRRLYTYDDDNLRIARIEVLLESPAGTPYRLRREVLYEPVWKQPVEATVWMRVENDTVLTPRNATLYKYDSFGRLAAMVQAGGDTIALPTRSYSYELESPVSRVITAQRSTVGGALDLEQIKCIDGRGRTVQERTRVASGQYLVTGFTTFNLKNNPLRQYQAYTSSSGECDTAPPSTSEYTLSTYDAADRLIQTRRSDDDLFSGASVRRIVHGPMSASVYDENDSDPDSDAAQTPFVQRQDGLGRVLSFERLPSAGGTPEVTTITYDELGRLRGYIDAAGHERVQTFDLLGRVLQVDDPNRGVTSYEYNDLGSVTRQTDARGRTVRMVYDGNNRLLERYEDGAREATLVQALYDVDPACDAAQCTNTAGLPVKIQTPATTDSVGYDVRGQRIYLGRLLEGVLFETRTQYDNAGRATHITYPDGQELDFEFDAGSRPIAIGDVLTDLTYEERGPVAEVTYGNGDVVRRSYDSLQRLSSLQVESAQGTARQDLELTYDRVGNLLAVHDQLQRAADEVGQGASYRYDAWYRLVEATLDPAREREEVLSFTLDAIDNLSTATSSLGEQSAAHVGDYTYDGAHPNAVATAGAHTFGYDAAGYMTGRDGATLDWDALGRLTVFEDASGQVSSYTYSGGNERVLKVEDGGVTHYLAPNFEMHDGVSALYVRVEQRRVARLESTALQTRVLSDVAPLDAPDGEIHAGDAWLAHADAEGIVDVSAATSAVERLLLGAARRLLFEHRAARTYFHHDHQGSTIAAVAPDGSSLGTAAYFPYGQLRASTGDCGDYGFTGQELDDGSGLTHFAHRYLDTAVGRWIQPDPLYDVFSDKGMTAERLDEALGAYSYVSGNPTTYTDPDGLAKGDSKKKEIKRPLDDHSKKMRSDAKKGVMKKAALKILGAVIGAAIGLAIVALVVGTGGIGLAAIAGAAATVGIAILVASVTARQGFKEANSMSRELSDNRYKADLHQGDYHQVKETHGGPQDVGALFRSGFQGYKTADEFHAAKAQIDKNIGGLETRLGQLAGITKTDVFSSVIAPIGTGISGGVGKVLSQ